MTKGACRFFTAFLACLFINAPFTPALSIHRGAVTALLIDPQGNIISAGEDGFLGFWNGHDAQERYQISPYGIRSVVLRPGTNQLAVIESDGQSLYRVSAWDYETWENLFTLRFRNPISFINYSVIQLFSINNMFK